MSMITVDDINDAFVTAQVEVSRQISEIMRAYYAPEIERAGVMLWAQLPEDAKNIIRMTKPEAAKVYDEKLKQIRKGNQK